MFFLIYLGPRSRAITSRSRSYGNRSFSESDEDQHIFVGKNTKVEL